MNEREYQEKKDGKSRNGTVTEYARFPRTVRQPPTQ